MRGGVTLTLSVFDVNLTSVGGVVSIGVSVLLQVAGPSRVDVTTILMEALEVTGVSLTPTNCERQSAALLWAPDIHSKVIFYVASSSDHLCLHFYHSETCVGVCGCCVQQCQIHVDSSSTLLQHSKCHRLPVW